MIKKYFSKDVDIKSPVQIDVMRVVNYDEDGNEFITWPEVDYPKIQAANGTISDWTLDNLLAAGINPDFPIHTGNPTRLDGVDVVSQAEAIADSILAEQNNEEK